MLLQNFYTASNSSNSENIISADIIFNPAHDIFKGHFPQQPVVPGVCMVQIVKQVLEQSISQSTQLSKAGNIKFLSMIVPVENEIIKLKINYKNIGHELDVSADLSNHQNPVFKFKGSFVVK
jgi:3-hydroxyacyl-[acyl-carrier-protein] dehydratase